VPEGDTIHRSAARLASAIAGREVVRYQGPRLGVRAPAPGTIIDQVEAKGKYLLVHFADGTVLETHLRMNGSGTSTGRANGGVGRGGALALSSRPTAGSPCASLLLTWFCGPEARHRPAVARPETIGVLTASDRRRLVETANEQLGANLGPGPRTTVPEGLAVYGRAGRRCRRCGSTILRGRHGLHERSTYWCPTCQPHHYPRPVPGP
jgi:endonuclease-8